MEASIRDILQDYRVDIADESHHHTRPGWLNIDCPLCGKVGNYRLGINLTFNYANCWACGNVPLNDVLVHVCGVDFKKAKQLRQGLQSSEATQIERRGKLKLPKPLKDLSPAHMRYLESRGLDEKTVEDWRLQATDFTSSMPWRIVAPIQYRGKVVSWTSRNIRKNGLRWLSASQDEEIINHKHILYGGDFLTYKGIIVEGPSDTWAVGKGYAAGLCGIGYSMQQVAILSTFHKLIVCFDSTKEAQRRAKKIISELTPFVDNIINVELDAEDPGSATEKELKKLRKLL